MSLPGRSVNRRQPQQVMQPSHAADLLLALSAVPLPATLDVCDALAETNRQPLHVLVAARLQPEPALAMWHQACPGTAAESLLRDNVHPTTATQMIKTETARPSCRQCVPAPLPGLSVTPPDLAIEWEGLP